MQFAQGCGTKGLLAATGGGNLRRVMKIAIFANTDWYIYNFRLNLIKSLKAEGFEIIAMGPGGKYSEKIKKDVDGYHELSLAGSSINPFSELYTLYHIRKILSSQNIDLVLSYTPKANIYASLVAYTLKCKVFVNVSGLGRVFIRETMLTRFVKMLYRLSFARADIVFFQNHNDRDFFLLNRFVEASRTMVLPGSGVDLERFAFSEERRKGGHFVFLLVARMLWDKGVGEYVEAARQIKRIRSEVKFFLLGSLDSHNPSTIRREVVEGWVGEGVIEYYEPTDRVENYLKVADCVVLPSYREGTPRSLLEAASMGIPVITTDATGCRNVVEDGVTGYLCRTRDAEDLKEKMLKMLALSPAEREKMGVLGRRKMEREYDENIVINEYLTRINNVAKEMGYR